MFFKGDIDYIVSSNPIRTSVTDDDVVGAIEGFKTNGWLTKSQVSNLLDWTVENTRKNIERYIGRSIKNDDLTGLCGFARSSSLFPFEGLFKVTYNSTVDFPFVIDDLRHAFGTVTFPLKDGDKIVNKEYLIDVAVRQFFVKDLCCNPDYRLDGTFFMYPGYFICGKLFKTSRSVSIAKELLRKGYIELTDEVFKLYIESFMLSSIYSTNQQYLHNLKNINVNDYKSMLMKYKPYELEFDRDSLLRCGCSVDLPSLNGKVR